MEGAHARVQGLLSSLLLPAIDSVVQASIPSCTAVLDALADAVLALKPLALHDELVAPPRFLERPFMLTDAQVSATSVRNDGRASDAFTGRHVLGLMHASGRPVHSTILPPPSSGGKSGKVGEADGGWQSASSPPGGRSMVVVALRAPTHVSSCFVGVGPPGTRPQVLTIEVLRMRVSPTAARAGGEHGDGGQEALQQPDDRDEGEGGEGLTVGRHLPAEMVGMFVSAACADGGPTGGDTRSKTNDSRWTRVARLPPAALDVCARVEVHRPDVVGLRLTFDGFSAGAASKQRHALRSCVLYETVATGTLRLAQQDTPLGKLRLLQGMAVAVAGRAQGRDDPRFAAAVRLLAGLALTSGSLHTLLDLRRVVAGGPLPPRAQVAVRDAMQQLHAQGTWDGAACTVYTFPRLLPAPHRGAAGSGVQGSLLDVTDAVTVDDKGRGISVARRPDGVGWDVAASTSSTFAALSVGLCPGEGTLVWEASIVMDVTGEECQCMGLAMRPVGTATPGYEHEDTLFMWRAYNGYLYNGRHLKTVGLYHRGEPLLFELDMREGDVKSGTLSVQHKGAKTVLFTGLCKSGKRLYPAMQFYSSGRAAMFGRVWVSPTPGAHIPGLDLPTTLATQAQGWVASHVPRLVVPPRLDGRGRAFGALPVPASADAYVLPETALAPALSLVFLGTAAVVDARAGKGALADSSEPLVVCVPGRPDASSGGAAPACHHVGGVCLVQHEGGTLTLPLELNGGAAWEDARTPLALRRGFAVGWRDSPRGSPAKASSEAEGGVDDGASHLSVSFRVSVQPSPPAQEAGPAAPAVYDTFTCKLGVVSWPGWTLPVDGAFTVSVRVQFVRGGDRVVTASAAVLLLNAERAQTTVPVDVVLPVPLGVSGVHFRMRWDCTGLAHGQHQEAVGGGSTLPVVAIHDPMLRAAPWVHCTTSPVVAEDDHAGAMDSALSLYAGLWRAAVFGQPHAPLPEDMPRTAPPDLLPYAVEATPDGLTALACALSEGAAALASWVEGGGGGARPSNSALLRGLRVLVGVAEVNIRRVVTLHGGSAPKAWGAASRGAARALRAALVAVRGVARRTALATVTREEAVHPPPAHSLACTVDQLLGENVAFFHPSREELSSFFRALFRGGDGNVPAGAVVELRLRWPVVTQRARPQAPRKPSQSPAQQAQRQSRAPSESSSGDDDDDDDDSDGDGNEANGAGSGEEGGGKRGDAGESPHTGSKSPRSRDGSHSTAVALLEADGRFDRLVLRLQAWADEQRLVHATLGQYDPLLPPLPAGLTADQAAARHVSGLFRLDSVYSTAVALDAGGEAPVPALAPRTRPALREGVGTSGAVRLHAHAGFLSFLVDCTGSTHAGASPHSFLSRTLPALLSDVGLHGWSLPAGLPTPCIPLTFHTSPPGGSAPDWTWADRPDVAGIVRVFPHPAVAEGGEGGATPAPTPLGACFDAVRAQCEEFLRELRGRAATAQEAARVEARAVAASDDRAPPAPYACAAARTLAVGEGEGEGEEWVGGGEGPLAGTGPLAHEDAQGVEGSSERRVLQALLAVANARTQEVVSGSGGGGQGEEDRGVRVAGGDDHGALADALQAAMLSPSLAQRQNVTLRRHPGTGGSRSHTTGGTEEEEDGEDGQFQDEEEEEEEEEDEEEEEEGEGEGEEDEEEGEGEGEGEEHTDFDEMGSDSSGGHHF